MYNMHTHRGTNSTGTCKCFPTCIPLFPQVKTIQCYNFVKKIKYLLHTIKCSWAFSKVAIIWFFVHSFNDVFTLKTESIFAREGTASFSYRNVFIVACHGLAVKSTEIKLWCFSSRVWVRVPVGTPPVSLSMTLDHDASFFG